MKWWFQMKNWKSTQYWMKSNVTYYEGFFQNWDFSCVSVYHFISSDCPFRSLGSWTLSSGLETSGLFSRRPAGIPRDRDIFQTQWKSTRAAITKADTTKTAMGQVVGIASRRVWGRPQMSLGNSPVAPLLLPIRFNRWYLHSSGESLWKEEFFKSFNQLLMQRVLNVNQRSVLLIKSERPGSW